MSDFRLKVFHAVARNLSFTKASQELFISQPAITKHIQELESTYQTRLFERQGGKISLTESGRLLLEHCERILEEYRKLEYEMHLLHNQYTGKLRWVPVQPSPNTYFPPCSVRSSANFHKLNYRCSMAIHAKWKQPCRNIASTWHWSKE